MYYIGVDLGGMSIKAGIVDENGGILTHGKVHTERHRHYSNILEDMANLCKQLLLESNLTEKDIYSIGVGSPGIPE